MYQFSDSDSKDSDEGIRFKTDSTRNKTGRKTERKSSSQRRRRSRSRDRSRRSSRKKSRDSRRKSSSSDRNRSRRKIEPRSSSRREPSRRKSSPLEKTVEKPSKSDVKRKKEPRVSSKSLPEEVGPQPPPNLPEKEVTKNPIPIVSSAQVQQEEEPSCIGPVLPPHLNEEPKDTKSCIGPALPPHLLLREKSEDAEEVKANIVGPLLPSHLREKLEQSSGEFIIHGEDEEQDVYGPLPVGHSDGSEAQVALEERALELKLKQLGNNAEGDQGPIREEWMLELPEVKASRLGLGPRQFRSKAGPDLSDRSSWTSTPNDKKKKKVQVPVDLKKEAEMLAMKRHDSEQEAVSKELKKKRKDSLLDLHQDKLKKKQKDDKSGPSERRPFSRDVDLQVNRFDEAQKKAILKKAQLLDDRFSRGQSKFL